MKFDAFQPHVMTTNDKVSKMNEIGGETSFVFNEKLKELEDERNMIMSKPIKDRAINIFKDTLKEEVKPDKNWLEDRDETVEER